MSTSEPNSGVPCKNPQGKNVFDELSRHGPCLENIGSCMFSQSQFLCLKKSYQSRRPLFSVSDEKENKSGVIQSCRMFHVTTLFTGFQ